MVRNLDRGEAVHNLIARVEFPDIDIGIVLAGNQDGMRGQVIHQGSGDDRVLVVGRAVSAGKILIAEPGARADDGRQDEGDQDFQGNMAFFLRRHSLETEGARQVPGAGSAAVCAGGRRIIGPAFGENAVFVHDADAVPDFRFLLQGLFAAGSGLYAHGRHGHIVMADPAWADGRSGFFRDDDLGSGALALFSAQEALLALSALALALFQVLHFPGQRIPGVGRRIHLAEFVSAQV